MSFCIGLIQSYGYVNNPVPDHNEVRVQYFAPNNNLVVDRTVTIASSGWYGVEYGISREDGKGNYTVIATYDASLQVEKEFPSWINNDPVFIYLTAWDTGDSVHIQARVGSSIAGEEVSVSIVDPNNSTTATYTKTINCKLIFQQFIHSELDQVFPISGNYTITATHVPTGVNSTIMFEYVR